MSRLRRVPYASFRRSDVCHVYRDYVKSSKYHRFYKIQSLLSIANHNNRRSEGYTLRIECSVWSITESNVDCRNNRETSISGFYITCDPNDSAAVIQKLQELHCSVSERAQQGQFSDAVAQIVYRKLHELVDLFFIEMANLHQANQLTNPPLGYGESY